MQNAINRITAPIVIVLLIIIAIIAYENYKSQKLQQQAALFYKLQDDFFFKNEKINKMLKCVEEDRPFLTDNGGEFSECDMDDYLGFFELLNLYVDDNVLPFEWIDNQFGYCITHAFNDPEIKDYITKIRLTPYPNEAYIGFEGIAKKLIKNESKFLPKTKNKPAPKTGH